MYENFERLMRQKGVHAVDVAHATGIATSTLSEWKSGKTQPKLDKLKRIADYFHVPLSALTGETDRESTGLNAEEWELVHGFRSLDLRARARILNALTFELSQKDGAILTKTS